MKNRFALALILLAASAAGCSDTATAPFGPHDPALRHGAVPPALERLDPLAADVSATARIGADGGSIRIPEAGFRIDIPAGALPLDVAGDSIEITVTALKGARIAYTFAPQGLGFREPVELIQDMDVTTFAGQSDYSAVVGVRFWDPSTLDGGATPVTEFEATAFEEETSRLTWTVDRFSGYLLASL